MIITKRDERGMTKRLEFEAEVYIMNTWNSLVGEGLVSSNHWNFSIREGLIG